MLRFDYLYNEEIMNKLLKVLSVASLMFTAMLSTSLVVASEIKIVVEHWPPWEIATDAAKQNVTGGLAVELSKELFGRLGYNVKLQTRPWKRAILNIQYGKTDVIPMISKTQERAVFMVFTKPMYKDPLVIAYSSDKFETFNWDQWADIKAFRIGIVNGYSYGKNWDKAAKNNQFDIEFVRSDKLNLKKVLKDRISLTLQYYSTARSIVKEIEGGEKTD